MRVLDVGALPDGKVLVAYTAVALIMTMTLTSRMNKSLLLMRISNAHFQMVTSAEGHDRNDSSKAFVSPAISGFYVLVSPGIRKPFG